MNWWTIIVRLLVTAGIGWATFKLLRDGVTAPRYSAAVLGLFVIAVIWVADLEHASRIAVLGIEIDRRIELAEDAIHRLDELESSATKTVERLDTLTAKAQAIAEGLSELVEKESLRRWAMILPSGRLAVNPAGEVSTPGSPVEGLYQKIFKLENREWQWGCDDGTVSDLTVLSKREPQVPYAAVARAACLKQRGDTSWRTEAERAKGLLEKLKALEPHVTAIDDFYKFCVELLG